MKFFKIFNIAKLVLDGVRAIIRVVRKDKPKNKLEDVLDTVDDITDVIPMSKKSND